jgi:hypothetical protein
MLKVFYITYTEDKGVSFKRISVPAENLTQAYVELQLRLPEAEITAIELSGKIITIKEAE